MTRSFFGGRPLTSAPLRRLGRGAVLLCALAGCSADHDQPHSAGGAVWSASQDAGHAWDATDHAADVMLVADAGSDGANVALSGLVQKGPFSQGGTVQLRELDAHYVATGRVFDANIEDATGRFHFSQLSLQSPFVELFAQGSYFNEVSGAASDKPLTLRAIVDLRASASPNINVLTHLAYGRVRALLAAGQPFADATAQSDREVASMFAATQLSPASSLDLSQSGPGSAFLLAASSVLQGDLDVDALTALLAQLHDDLAGDGTLDDASIRTALANAARLLDVASVRKNLTDYYASHDVGLAIADFEAVVQAIVSASKGSFTADIRYPAEGSWGPNLLDPARTDYPTGTNSFVAALPRGSSLRIKLVLVGASDFAQDGGPSASWGYLTGQNGGWDVSLYDGLANTQEFVALQLGARIPGRLDVQGVATADPPALGLELFYGAPGSLRVEYYEDGDTTPTRTKLVTWH